MWSSICPAATILALFLKLLKYVSMPAVKDTLILYLSGKHISLILNLIGYLLQNLWSFLGANYTLTWIKENCIPLRLISKIIWTTSKCCFVYLLNSVFKVNIINYVNSFRFYSFRLNNYSSLCLNVDPSDRYCKKVFWKQVSSINCHHNFSCLLVISLAYILINSSVFLEFW